jgi:CheY-like chemotaxis protein
MNGNTKQKKTMTVLVIEDEPIIRENIQLLLELEGYPVKTASNGEEGLQILRTLPHPCLILLDLLMPVMNGFEFLESKSHNEIIASIPVCVLSGVAEKPRDLKASAFLKKPLDFNVLLKFVRQYCGDPQSI